MWVYSSVSLLRGPLILGAFGLSFFDFVAFFDCFGGLSRGGVLRICDESTSPIARPLRVLRAGGLGCDVIGVAGDPE